MKNLEIIFENLYENIEKYFVKKDIKINDSVYKKINGKSYVENPYIKLEDLRYLNVLYYDFNDNICKGEIIVNKYIADDILDIFKELFKNKYQLNSVRLIEDYWMGDGISSDEASMHANNTSCFNYRDIAGKKKLSNHALGQAIDFNPVYNPYVQRDDDDNNIYDGMTDDEIKYALNRDETLPHVITHNDLVYKLFDEKGYVWGGDWGSPETDPTYAPGDPVDYQHFEKEVISRVKK